MEEHTQHTQWHQLDEVTEGSLACLVKRYVPDSYEIRNELSWLTSNIFRACQRFQTPLVVEASISQGYIKLIKVDNEPKLKPEEILGGIVALAAELHSVIKSPEPRLRNQTSAGEFIPYLKRFTAGKIALIEPEINLDPGVKTLIMGNLDSITTPYFSVVHRDLRYRHVLQTGDNKPVLIDWEFTNISHFGHDLGKLACDYVVNHGADLGNVVEEITQAYHDLTGLPEDQIFEAMRAFAPLVLLEHSASFVQRKCPDYLAVAQRNIEQLAVFALL